jgi:insertion element IS1 protein InsB
MGLRGASVPSPAHSIERNHARQRHWFAPFRRGSIVVSKAERVVNAAIALFARFGGNDKIGELVAVPS